MYYTPYQDHDYFFPSSSKIKIISTNTNSAKNNYNFFCVKTEKRYYLVIKSEYTVDLSSFYLWVILIYHT